MLDVKQYPSKGKDRLYNGYFEVVHAADKTMALACKCEVGQFVGRIYVNGGGCVAELAGTASEAEAFVKMQMAKLKVKE